MSTERQIDKRRERERERETIDRKWQSLSSEYDGCLPVTFAPYAAYPVRVRAADREREREREREHVHVSVTAAAAAAAAPTGALSLCRRHTTAIHRCEPYRAWISRSELITKYITQIFTSLCARINMRIDPDLLYNYIQSITVNVIGIKFKIFSRKWRFLFILAIVI